MGIEALGSIGSAMAGLGEAMKAPLGNIVKESPVALADFKNTMPLQVGSQPVEVINFQKPVETLDTQAAVAEAENILAQARMPVGEIKPEINIKPVGIVQPVREVVLPQAEPMVAPWVLFAPSTTKTENRVVFAAATPNALSQPALQEQEVKEAVEEKVEKQEPKERLEEEVIERQMYLEDEDASAQRRIEIGEAIVKARTEADRLGLKKLTGWLVAKFLPGEHEGNRSQVVRKTGPDGSYQETVEAITGAGELESREKAVEKFDAIIAEKKPVKFGKNGNPVGNIDVVRVFKYRLIKPIQAHEEVAERIIKKKEIKVEPNLEELNPALAEVFQKTA